MGCHRKGASVFPMLQLAADQMKQGGLPRTVRPEQGASLAGCDLQADAVYGYNTAKRLETSERHRAQRDS